MADKRGAPKGHQKWGGRQRGTPNKATASVREAAQQWTELAIGVLATIMLDEEEDSRGRVAAAKELLDRGHGKSAQPIGGDPDGAPLQIQEIRRIIVKAASKK